MIDELPPWIRIGLGDEERRVIEALATLQASAAEPTSLAAAARKAGVNPNTSRAWRARHEVFGEAVALILARPEPEPEMVIEPEPEEIVLRATTSRANLAAEVDDARASLRHETQRLRAGLFCDVSQARGRLRRAEGRLRALDQPPVEIAAPAATQDAR